MTFSTLQNAIWAATFTAYLPLLGVLFQKRLNRVFPVFTAWLTFSISVSALLFVISRYGTNHAYFNVYWLTAFGDYAFQVAVIYELARIVLRPAGVWVSDAQRSFLTWGAIGCLVAATISLCLGRAGMRGLDLWDQRISTFTSLLTCELFVAVSFAAGRIGLRWRSHAAAIGGGLAAWAFVALAADLLNGILGWTNHLRFFKSIHQCVYFGAQIFWTISLWRPEKVSSPIPYNRDARPFTAALPTPDPLDDRVVLPMNSLALFTALLLLGQAILQGKLNQRRLARMGWHDLVAKLDPLPNDGIAAVAIDYLNPHPGQTRLQAYQLWTMVGGLHGLARMRSNADILLVLAGYTARWNFVEAVVVAERMRSDALMLRRATFDIAVGLTLGVGRIRGPFRIQEAASAYFLMRERLLALYETSHAGRYSTLAAAL